jgi:hypothetical protein
MDPVGGGPFNVTALGNALVRRLEEDFSEFRLNSADPDPAEGSEFERVTFYLGAAPNRERAADASEVGPEFPMVVVVPRLLVDGDDDSVVTVDLVIGARRLNAEGHADVWAIVEHIRTNLKRKPVIANRARMELPLEVEVGESAARAQRCDPQWWGVMTAQFNIPQPVEETFE